ncbi:MAG: PspC domain-containing protein [Pedobacter sp.]|nr:MAG: PspC domain-containing protein [Pedobacter sp.]
MKKTLHINIGNSITLIEEDAYEMLTVYLNEVKFHFAKSVDNFEIVTDIENRIAELFGEMLAVQQKKVISIEDVQEIIRQMGSVQDFELSEDEPVEIYNEGPQATVKKLYRDTDHAMIAGVCVGLSHFLNIDARWVRLIAFATIFLGGSGILAYIVLWIMIPKAATKSEKLFMRGEEANLRGFANSYLQPFVKESRGVIAQTFHVLGDFVQGTGKVIFKIVSGFIIAMSAFGLVFLMVALVALLGVSDSDVVNQFPFSIVNDEYFTALTIGAFLACTIPLLSLLLFSVRVAFTDRSVNKTLSFVLLIIWLAGMGITIFHVAKISSEFKENAEFAQTAMIKPYQNFTLEIDKTRFFTKEDSVKYHIDQNNYKGKKILYSQYGGFDEQDNVRLSIEKSNDQTVSVNQNYSSQGSTFEDALKNAQNIHYRFVQQDSLLTFSPVLRLIHQAKWRDQEVRLTLKVPVGTTFYINRDINRYLNNYNIWDCHHEDRNDYVEMIMTADGLKCKHEKEENMEQ